MEERTFEQIQNDLLPDKSKLIYEKEWNRFDEFLLSKNYPSAKAVQTELVLQHFSEYFEYLHKVKLYSGSTIWQKYSMINSLCKLHCGFFLQKKFPQLTPQLQKYDTISKEKKKAAVFDFEELNSFWFREYQGKLLTTQVIQSFIITYFNF